MKLNTRGVAAKIIDDVVTHRKSLSDAMAAYIDKAPHTDHALVKEISFGVCRFYYQLYFYRTALLSKPLKSKESYLNQLILVGLYQLIYCRVPTYAAISETVNAAKATKKPWAGGMVNAVLRNFERQRDALTEKMETCDEARFAHPQWLIDSLQKYWPEDYQAILQQNNVYPPPFTLRVNNKQTTRDEYLSALDDAEISATAHPLAATALTLDAGLSVEKLPGFNEGVSSVQDAASQLILPLLDLSAGQRVLDACAAPGGKTALILENVPDLSACVAVDIDETRIERIEDNLSRLGLQATVLAHDVSQTKDWWDGQCFDRILLDAPCSATGVIRRHPDIKLLRHYSDIEAMAARQLSLLTAMWPLLAPGGHLLYTTCSVLPVENEAVIDAFLEKTPNAQAVPIANSWGRTQTHGRQILPGDDGMDGFYFAKLSCV